MASERAKKVWEKGFPISDAWLRFAPSDLGSEYARIPEFLEGLNLDPQPASGFEILTSIADGMAKSQSRRKLENEMKEHLLTELFNGELIAAGYREFPSIGQSPVIINSAKFELDDPGWRGETLEAHGVRFGRIRVADLELFSVSAKPERQSGSIAAINQAVTELGSRLIHSQKATAVAMATAERKLAASLS